MKTHFSLWTLTWVLVLGLVPQARGDESDDATHHRLVGTVGIVSGLDERLSLESGLELNAIGILPNDPGGRPGGGIVVILDGHVRFDVGMLRGEGGDFEPFLNGSAGYDIFYGFTTQVGDRACGFVYGPQSAGEIEERADDAPGILRGQLTLHGAAGLGCSMGPDLTLAVIALAGLGYANLEGHEVAGGSLAAQFEMWAGNVQLTGEGGVVVGENTAVAPHVSGGMNIAVNEDVLLGVGMRWSQVDEETDFAGTLRAMFAL